MYNMLKRNDCMTNEQLVFFTRLQQIQEEVVTSQNNTSDKLTEKEIYNLTYDTIYKILELIDGYTSDKIDLDLIDKLSGNSIKKEIQLHDKCVEYLTVY